MLYSMVQFRMVLSKFAKYNDTERRAAPLGQLRFTEFYTAFSRARSVSDS